MITHFADRLLEAVAAKGAPICVGIDPQLERLPASVLTKHELTPLLGTGSLGRIPSDRAAAAIEDYGRGVIDAVAPTSPAVKLNIAFFEMWSGPGLHAYALLATYARERGLLVIGDVKRADIGHSSAAYATAHLEPHPDRPTADAITINPYFADDGVEPFFVAAQKHGKGVFVLVQTSNPSAAAIQGIPFGANHTVADRVAGLVERWASAPGRITKRGYSCVGAVVSPRDAAATLRLRELMPNCLFLVPGFGAQGRTPDEVALCFKHDGTGALVSASRSVGFAFAESGSHGPKDDWRPIVAAACETFASSVRAALPRR